KGNRIRRLIAQPQERFMTATFTRLATVLLCGLLAHAQATAAILVAKGQSRAVIILPEQASPVVEHAARVLRDHIKEMSGAELPIRTEDKVTGSPSREQAWILVGESKLTEKLGLTSKGLGPGGIVVYAKGDVVALFGVDAGAPSDPHGTRYAVT